LYDQYPGDPSDLSGQPVESTASGYVCEIDNVPVGFVTWVQHEQLGHYVDNLYVESRWQRQGIGALLLQKMQQEFDELALHVHKAKAVVFYEKNGFQIVCNAGTQNKHRMEWRKTKSGPAN